MTNQKHGLTIGIERVNTDFFLSLKAVGKLTHKDYEIITPMIDAALAGYEYPHIKALVDGSELDGWDLRAAWDDFRLGLKHGSKFDKVAIYGNKDWQKMTAKIGAWFISGEVKYFRDYNEALTWLKG